MIYHFYIDDFLWDIPMLDCRIRTALPAADKEKVQIYGITGVPVKANKDYG
jgi:hypothetical protein